MNEDIQLHIELELISVTHDKDYGWEARFASGLCVKISPALAMTLTPGDRYKFTGVVSTV